MYSPDKLDSKKKRVAKARPAGNAQILIQLLINSIYLLLPIPKT